MRELLIVVVFPPGVVLMIEAATGAIMPQRGSATWCMTSLLPSG